PTGVVDGDAAPTPADDARSRAVRRPPRHRPRSPELHRPPRAPRHSWPLGPDRRVWTRPRRRRRGIRRPHISFLYDLETGGGQVSITEASPTTSAGQGAAGPTPADVLVVFGITG